MERHRDANKINGSWGEVWVDNDYMADVISFEAKFSLTLTEVKQNRRLNQGYKVTGTSGSGKIKLNKVTSYFLNKLSTDLKAGKTTVATIITKLDDPDALGAERIRLNNCVFSELPIAGWEVGSLTEEEIPFNFEDFEILDSIEG